jgi:hypothetical protein
MDTLSVSSLVHSKLSSKNVASSGSGSGSGQTGGSGSACTSNWITVADREGGDYWQAYPNYDLGGVDLKEVQGDLSECQRKCGLEYHCKGFTRRDSANKCWLKTDFRGIHHICGSGSIRATFRTNVNITKTFFIP